MPVNHVALVIQSRRVTPGQASEVAAAIQRQVTRDFGPIWDIEATVDAFAHLDDVPPGYWPVIVRDELPIKGAIGIHLDSRGQPFALVRRVSYWPFVASHEVLEMLADPFGNRVVPGGSLKPGQGIVDYVVEPCDPCGSPQFGYSVNGILVSDFVTPNYYHDPVPVPGARYSFTGAVDRPRSVLQDGYVAWRDPVTQIWWRAERVGSPRLRFRRLGEIEFDGTPLRERIDEDPALPFLYQGVSEDDPAVQAAMVRYLSSRAASRANAADWEGAIAAKGGAPPPPPTDIDVVTVSVPHPAAQAATHPAERPGVWPKLPVPNVLDAIDIYAACFGAELVFTSTGPGPKYAQMVIDESAVWLFEETSAPARSVVLINPDPQAAFDRAVAAGATAIQAATESDGWLRAVLDDSFGHTWEIGTPLGEWPPTP